MDKNIEFKQVILVTDGESNVGINPVKVAEKMNKLGISVSTIGIVNNQETEKPLAEIQEIASKGGGVWEITDIKNLSKTMQMVTKKSTYKTIEEAVSKELKTVLGKNLDNIHPNSRKKILNVIEKIGDEMEIKCCIVIDCSGSMASKMHVAKKSIINLFTFLSERKAKTEIAVISYPGISDELYKISCNFTEDVSTLNNSLQHINTGGTTPTGDALEAAVELFEQNEYEIENKLQSGVLNDSIV